MDRILLIIKQRENRHLLTALLEPYYSILLYNSHLSLAEPFDLCILDGLALKRYQSELQARREGEEPVFLPFVLLITHPQMKLIPDVLPSQVDEALTIPIEKVELLARVKALLRSRRLSLQLKAANEQLQQLNAIKTRFINIASHDLRNPLSAISTSAQLLYRYHNLLPQERLERIFQLMQGSIKTMTQLLDDILIINRAKEGNLTFSPSFFNLNEFCQELIDQFQITSGSNYEIVLLKNPSQSLPSPSQVYMDQSLLRHILSNLLDNGIKYSPDGGRISLQLTYEETEVIFRVRDLGIGIPLEKQENLYEAFERGSNVKKIPGTGLGLSIVKQCVELHRGTINCQSEVGVGTTFIVALPYR